MTTWYAVLQTLGVVAFLVAVWKGGSVERRAALILLGNNLLTVATDELGASQPAAVVALIDGATAVLFLWLALRHQRWWLLTATAALTLCTATWTISLVNPSVSFYTAASAEIGEWAVVYLALLAGAGERWLAGERAAPLGRPPGWADRGRT